MSIFLGILDKDSPCLDCMNYKGGNSCGSGKRGRFNDKNCPVYDSIDKRKMEIYLGQEKML